MVEQDGTGFDALCGLPDGPRAVADAVEDEMPDVLDVEGAAGGFGVEKFDGLPHGGENLGWGGVAGLQRGSACCWARKDGAGWQGRLS